MRNSARASLRKGLEKEVGSEIYRKLFERLRTTCEVLAGFEDWLEVASFATSSNTSIADRHNLLRTLLTETKCNRQPSISAVFTLIFWPQLCGLFARSRQYDSDKYELWQNIVGAFLEALDNLDVQGQAEYLIPWVCYEVKHRVHRLYWRRWRSAERERACLPEDLEDLAGGRLDPGFDAIDVRDARDAEIERLREHVRSGKITEADFLLLVATRLYGHPIAECARQIGMSYESAKKRKQRMEAGLGLPARER